MFKCSVVLSLISVCCLPQAAFSQTSGVNTLDGTISGSYSGPTGSSCTSDEYISYSSATYTRPDGSPAYGETVNYPRMKAKWYNWQGNLMSPEPDLFTPTPDMGVAADEGQSEVSMFGFIGITSGWNTFSVLYGDGTPEGAGSLVRQWKLMGYAFSDEAQTVSINVLDPNFSQIQA